MSLWTMNMLVCFIYLFAAKILLLSQHTKPFQTDPIYKTNLQFPQESTQNPTRIIKNTFFFLFLPRIYIKFPKNYWVIICTCTYALIFVTICTSIVESIEKFCHFISAQIELCSNWFAMDRSDNFFPFWLHFKSKKLKIIRSDALVHVQSCSRAKDADVSIAVDCVWMVFIDSFLNHCFFFDTKKIKKILHYIFLYIRIIIKENSTKLKPKVPWK